MSFDIEINKTQSGGKQYRTLYDISLTKVVTPLQMMPCCLCGEEVPHGRVQGKNVTLLFRASENMWREVWVPVKPHARNDVGPHGQFCPDPPDETRQFWQNVGKREKWKWGRRLELTKDREEREAEIDKRRRSGRHSLELK